MGQAAGFTKVVRGGLFGEVVRQGTPEGDGGVGHGVSGKEQAAQREG